MFLPRNSYPCRESRDMKSQNYHKMLVLKTKAKHFMDHWNPSSYVEKIYRITTKLIPKESNGHHTLPPNHGVIGIYAWAWTGLNSHLDLRGSTLRVHLRR